MKRRNFIAAARRGGGVAVRGAREASTMLDITLSVNLARFLLRGLQ